MNDGCLRSFVLYLTANDTQDTDVLALVSFDTQSGSQFVSLEANRRLGSAWELEAEIRGFFDMNNAIDGSTVLNNEDYVQLTLRRFW